MSHPFDRLTDEDRELLAAEDLPDWLDPMLAAGRSADSGSGKRAGRRLRSAAGAGYGRGMPVPPPSRALQELP